LRNAPELTLSGRVREAWPLCAGDAEAQADVSYRWKAYYDTLNVERLSHGDWTFVRLKSGFKPEMGEMAYGIVGRKVWGKTSIGDITPIEGLGFDLFSMGPCQTSSLFARFND
jgi:iron complex outermembrane recepter protein